MLAVVAFILFVLSFIFHGLGIDPSAWINWEGLSVLGLAFLAWHFIAPVAVPTIRR